MNAPTPNALLQAASGEAEATLAATTTGKAPKPPSGWPATSRGRAMHPAPASMPATSSAASRASSVMAARC